MADLLPSKFVKLTPIIQIVVLLFGTVLSFSIALAGGYVNAYVPFISETGAFSPAMCTFSLCLIIGSFVGAIMVYIRYCILSATGLVDNKLFLMLNNISCIIGLIAMFGLAGVAAFPMTTVYPIHLLAAAIYFVGMLMYFICITYTTYQSEGVSKLMKIRSVLSVSLIILLSLLIICFPISQKRWKDHNKHIPARKLPEDEGFTLILISSLLEWSIMGVVLLFTLSILTELRKHKVVIHVTPMDSVPVSEAIPRENVLA